MIFPIPGGKKIGSHYLPRYTRYRVIAGRVIKGGHCTNTHDTNTVSVSVTVAVSADVSWIHAGISYPMILTLCL